MRVTLHSLMLIVDTKCRYLMQNSTLLTMPVRSAALMNLLCAQISRCLFEGGADLKIGREKKSFLEMSIFY